MKVYTAQDYYIYYYYYVDTLIIGATYETCYNSTNFYVLYTNTVLQTFPILRS